MISLFSPRHASAWPFGSWPNCNHYPFNYEWSYLTRIHLWCSSLVNVTTETILSALSDMWCHTKLISSSLSLCSHHCSGLNHHGRRKQVAARQRHQSQGGGKERARSTQGKPTKSNSTGGAPSAFSQTNHHDTNNHTWMGGLVPRLVTCGPAGSQKKGKGNWGCESCAWHFPKNRCNVELRSHPTFRRWSDEADNLEVLLHALTIYKRHVLWDTFWRLVKFLTKIRDR